MAKIIKNTGSTQRKIDSKVVAKALGAKKIGIKINTRQGPISLFSLRQFLMKRLRSSGGRPALKGTIKRRKKIRLLPEDWDKLEKIAKYFKENERINVSPSQIASVLIHGSISKIDI